MMYLTRLDRHYIEASLKHGFMRSRNKFQTMVLRLASSGLQRLHDPIRSAEVGSRPAGQLCRLPGSSDRLLVVSAPRAETAGVHQQGDVQSWGGRAHTSAGCVQCLGGHSRRLSGRARRALRLPVHAAGGGRGSTLADGRGHPEPSLTSAAVAVPVFNIHCAAPGVVRGIVWRVGAACVAPPLPSVGAVGRFLAARLASLCCPLLVQPLAPVRPPSASADLVGFNSSTAMASTLVVPLQLVMLGADALFAMHSRLRQEVTGADTVPVAKCDTST